jgi:hypothetical protein
MTNTLKINYTNHTIIMDRTFAKLAQDTRSDEYARLQAVRRDYPTFTVVQRTIRKNENKKTYLGLTYEYMEEYMMTHGSEEERRANLRRYSELREIAACHGKAYRYPVIKSWFLDKYPEIVQFGIEEDASIAAQVKILDCSAEPMKATA